jgi:hypothetical protein
MFFEKYEQAPKNIQEKVLAAATKKWYNKTSM